MNLNVLLVSDQVRGIDGTGGLGDVATGLAKELAARSDMRIRLVMPGYQKISQKGLEDRFSDVVIERLPVPLGDEIVSVKVCRYALPKAAADEPDVTCYLLVEPNWFKQRDNSGVQGVLLSRATVLLAGQLPDFPVDLIHCNDWHTALIPVYLNTVYRSDPYLGRIATVYTAHNNSGAAYQGADDFRDVQHFAGLPDECYRPATTRSVEQYGRFNFAKGGFGFADLVNTVSLHYADELRSSAFGGGLEGVLRERAGDLCGIVNGIDIGEWDPATDPFISDRCHFSVKDPIEKIQEKKTEIRDALREWSHGTPAVKPFAGIDDGTLLIGVVTRISDQKMPVMLPLREDTGLPFDTPSPLERLCREFPFVQVAVLGSADRSDYRGQRYVERLNQLQRDLPDRVFFFNGFDIRLSHLIYAASEMFLVPSVYEPCGLTQLTSMRYGSVPIVRSVGGLRDTVLDDAESPSGNGFKFLETSLRMEDRRHMVDIGPAVELFYKTLVRAIHVRQNEGRWQELMRNGLSRDSSWGVPASQYRRLYEAAVQRKSEKMFCVPHTLEMLENRFYQSNVRLERLLTLPAELAATISKLSTGNFGPYELSEVFRNELHQLRDIGFVAFDSLDRIPRRGENLSDHISIREAGGEFIQLREQMKRVFG